MLNIMLELHEQLHLPSSVHASRIELMFDGEVLQADDTPHNIGLEDGDLLDLKEDQSTTLQSYHASNNFGCTSPPSQ